MTNHLLATLLAALALLGLSGCTSAGSDASVEFDGDGNGVDSDSADCDDEVTLVGSGTVDEGEVTVRVLNGLEEVFQETYDSEIALDGRVIEGEEGEWTLEATRSGEELLGDFNGEYTFRLDC